MTKHKSSKTKKSTMNAKLSKWVEEDDEELFLDLSPPPPLPLVPPLHTPLPRTWDLGTYPPSPPPPPGHQSIQLDKKTQLRKILNVWHVRLIYTNLWKKWHRMGIYVFVYTGRERLIRTRLIRSSIYRSGMVNSKSFVGKVFLRIKRKFELN